MTVVDMLAVVFAVAGALAVGFIIAGALDAAIVNWWQARLRDQDRFCDGPCDICDGDWT